MSDHSQASETSSLHPRRISKQQLELLNTKCQDIVQGSQGEQYSQANLFFNVLQWSSNNKSQRYNPELEEATAELHKNKNELLRELEHSTYKRKIRRIHKMNGEEISYIEHYNKVKPELQSMKNTLDTETIEKDDKHRKTLTKYPELKNHPKLLSFISDQIKHQSSVHQAEHDTKDEQMFVDGFIIPCRLIPIKSSYPKQSQTPPLKVSQIIQTRYNSKYIKKGTERRSCSEKKTNVENYPSLCNEQSNIINSNITLSKENKAKLSDSLDRIMKTVSPKKGKVIIPSVTTINFQARQTSQTIKFPYVDSLIHKRRK